jgi:CheY-like chemotaxis protein
VQSELGRGSCFRFRLQVSAGDETEAVSREAWTRRCLGLRAGQGEQRVLVVDDRDTNRDILCRLLGELGFVTREAVNGKEAVEQYAAWQPQVVLIDLVMPVMGGQDAIARMRALPALEPRTAIIALTASTMGDEQPAVLAAGADAFMRKPFRAEELLSEIERHTGLELEYDATVGTEGDAAEDAGAWFTAAAARLPDGLRAELYAVIRRGAITEAKALAERMAEQDAALAGLLAQRARDYRLNELEAHLEQG